MQVDIRGLGERKAVQVSDAVTSNGGWEHFQAENMGDDDMIVFSRPLRDVRPDEECVATSRLWTQSGSGLARGDGADD